jgi:hypothetical protein
MKYYASDIIKKARIAADLVNSDFIDWYEEVSLLNDSYQSLYQNLVEINDPAFVKIIETTDKRIQLPDDFHQLRCVTLLRNGFSTPILRRSFSESYNSMSYEILGSELHINTPCVQSPPDGVYHIEYFSSPATLLFPPKEQKLSSDFIVSGYKLWSSDTKWSFWESTNANAENRYVIYKFEDGQQSRVASFVEDMYDAVSTKYYLVSYGPNGWRAFDKQSEKITIYYEYVDNKRVPVIFEDGQLGFYNTLEHKIYLVNNITVNAGETSGSFESVFLMDVDEIPDARIIFMNYSGTDIWYEKSNHQLMHNGENIYYDSNMTSALSGLHDYVYRDGIIYAHILGSFVTVYPDNTIDIKHKVFDTMGDLDENTGLSLIRIKGEDVSLLPWVEDTLLDYPNSFFFQTITYSLAVQYKIKQGADASGLQAIYNSYYDNFMKSLPQDVYMPSRVNNVYTY